MLIKSIKLKAHAKLNLSLKVLDKRKDGYHNIESLMAPITLADDIKINLSAKKGVTVTATDPSLPKGKNNLAYRAADEFLKSVGIKNQGIKIHINKQIPVSAGLAGGSTDAAAVIRGLNTMFGSILKDRRLMEIAARVGSDVPFCLYGKPAMVTGRGEKLKPAPRVPKSWIVLVIPDLAVSTAWAYKNYDLTKSTTKWYNSVLRRFGINFSNDLERATALTYPQVSGIKEFLCMLEAQVVLMSGSGPSVFGLFKNRAKANRAYLALKRIGEVKVILTRIR